MNFSVIVAIILSWNLGEMFASASNSTNDESSLISGSGVVHSRQKRYIVFPKGSSLQLVYCNTYLFRPVVDIFRFGTTIGLAWQLPDDPEIYSEFKKKHKIYKRNVLKKAEGFMRPGGANGQQCVLRALCESGQRTPAKKEFLREIMHKIFSYDVENEDLEETHEDKIYRKAHQSANQDCESLYPECGFSIFNAIN